MSRNAAVGLAERARTSQERAVVSALHSAAEEVPAYRRILAQAGLSPASVTDIDDFRRLVPILDKQATFGSFPIAELCRGGRLGQLATVLTSSGHSGRFAFGLYGAESAEAAAERIDAALDVLFGVYSRRTLMINCLPMGVRIYTRRCTLADTSVRPDMATALVAELGGSYEQIILAGEAAFLKHVLELGRDHGIDWSEPLVHLIVGEEPLAENARTYLAGLLGINVDDPAAGRIGSSMGVAELGLNLFFEVPQLVALRRMLHEDADFRQMVLGPEATYVPMLFTYDAARIFVEIADDRRLVISTLDVDRRLPLIRYATGDVAELFAVPDSLRIAANAGLLAGPRGAGIPILMLHGRGEFARSAGGRIYPEQVKEGLYHDPSLAELTTANFRIRSGPRRALLRIQLSPGVAATGEVTGRFEEAVAAYVRCPLTVRCEEYRSFGGGMSLDYERKFSYIERD